MARTEPDPSDENPRTTGRAPWTTTDRAAARQGIAVGLSAAAYGIALATLEDDSEAHILLSAEKLKNSRQTVVNLAWAVNRMLTVLHATTMQRNLADWREASNIAAEDVVQNQDSGQHGLGLIKE